MHRCLIQMAVHSDPHLGLNINGCVRGWQQMSRVTFGHPVYLCCITAGV